MNNETTLKEDPIVAINIGYDYQLFYNEDDAMEYIVGNTVKGFISTRNVSTRLLNEIQSRIEKDHEGG